MAQSRNKVVYAIAQFLGSDAFVKDPSTFDPAAKLTAQHAPHGFRWGFQVEDPTNGVTSFAGWNSIHQHQEFQKSPDFAKLQELIKPCLANTPIESHASFIEGDELSALGAPVTEFALIVPNEGITPADVTRAVSNTTKAISKASYGAAWGEIIGKTDFCFVLGWSSVAAGNQIHNDLASEIDDAVKAAKVWVESKKGYADGWGEVATLTVIHLVLKEASA